MAEDLKQYIRTIPDFPVKGVQFRDITTLLLEPQALKASVDGMIACCKDVSFDYIVTVESRGFIFASAIAYQLGKPLVLVRKPGKLPGKTISQTYQYEYSEGSLEMHEDALAEGSEVLLIDDLLATGGTILAAVDLLKQVQASVALCLFVIDLPELKGGERLKEQGVPYSTLIEF